MTSINPIYDYDDTEEESQPSSGKKKIHFYQQQQVFEAVEDERPEVLCCGDKKLPKIFMMIFGLGAFVGFIDYFLVKTDLDRKFQKPLYLRPKGHGIDLSISFADYVALYGKSYKMIDEYKKREEIFEANRAEIQRIKKLDGSNTTYTMELNEFADISDAEFKTFFAGGKPMDERLDDSIFYDFEEDREIDNLYVQKYLDDMELNPLDEHGTLDESIQEIVPGNPYGPIGDDVLVNPYDQIGELSWEEATQDIRDMDFEKSIKDDAYSMDDYVKINNIDIDKAPKNRRLQPKVEIWPIQPVKPLELDWRYEGAVSRVKKQGRCGACWAIAAAGALEGASAIQTKKLVELSEQQILDCASMNPFRSGKCDGGYISEALRYGQTTLIATRDNYPYLGFNNTCRKISEEDLVGFKDLPKIQSTTQFKSLVEFWTQYFQSKFEKFPNIQENQQENKVSTSVEQLELYFRNLNLQNLEMDEYQIPLSPDDANLDGNHQWRVHNVVSESVTMLSEGLSYVDPVTQDLFTAEKNPNDITLVKTKKFHRIWQSSPRRLKLALKKGPVTVMVNSWVPFKFYREGILDTKACEPNVDHAVLAVGYGTYVNAEGKVDDYFILKNSWGRFWGEQGYARISANRKWFGKGVCGLYIESYIPQIETDQKEIEKSKKMLA